MVPNGQARGEQAEDEEGLRARLVGHVVLDGVRDEELDLRKHLRAGPGSSLRQRRITVAIRHSRDVQLVAFQGGHCRTCLAQGTSCMAL